VLPLVACRPRPPSLATRLLALAQGLHLPRIPVATYPHRRAGARWQQRPPQERFARAPVLTSYTPLHLEQGFHPSPLLSVTHQAAYPLEDGWAGYQVDGQDKVQVDNMPYTEVEDGRKQMYDEQEQKVELIYREQSNDIDKDEENDEQMDVGYNPEDMEAAHKDGYTVILPEGPMVEMKKYLMKNTETTMEVTEDPVAEVQEKVEVVEVVEVPVVDLVDALTEAGVVKLDWGSSIRAAMRGTTEEEVELYDQPMASKVEEEANYQAFPSRVEVPIEDMAMEVEVSSEPGVEAEYMKMMEMPGVMDSGITIEAPSGPVIEDNSLMQFEDLEPLYYEREDPAPYVRHEESRYFPEETRSLPDTLQPLAGDAIFRSPFFQSSGFSQEPFRIPEEFRTFLDDEPTLITK